VRIRIRYCKGALVRFISHLELMKTFHRALRRAQIPVAFSEGFNPRPKTSFGPPVSVGFTAENEYADINLKADMEAKEFIERLNASLPEGLKVLDAWVIDESSYALSAVINTAVYIAAVFIDKETTEDMAEGALAQFMAKDRIVINKKRKNKITETDIRPFVYEIKILEFGPGKLTLYMELALSNKGSVNPALVIEALKKEDVFHHITIKSVHREGLYVKLGDTKSPPRL
jgi:radical SAM-linked protein